MDKEKIESLINHLWDIRGSYHGEERADQKTAWEEIFECLDSEKNLLI